MASAKPSANEKENSQFHWRVQGNVCFVHIVHNKDNISLPLVSNNFTNTTINTPS